MKYLVMVIRANALSPDIRLFIEALDANAYRKVTIKEKDVIAVYLYKYVSDWRNEKNAKAREKKSAADYGI